MATGPSSALNYTKGWSLKHGTQHSLELMWSMAQSVCFMDSPWFGCYPVSRATRNWWTHSIAFYAKHRLRGVSDLVEDLSLMCSFWDTCLAREAPYSHLGVYRGACAHHQIPHKKDQFEHAESIGEGTKEMTTGVIYRAKGTGNRVPCVVASAIPPNLGKGNEEVWNCSTDSKTSWLVSGSRHKRY